MKYITICIIITFFLIPYQISTISYDCNNYVNTPSTPQDILYQLVDCQLYQIIYSIVEVESNWDSLAISETGDYGLMQINKYWWGHRFDWNKICEVEYNLQVGITIYKEYLDLSGGNHDQALYRYNGSRKYIKLIRDKQREVFGNEIKN